MRFVVFGLTVSSSWGNGHATLWRGLIRALAALGHKVTFFERDVPYMPTIATCARSEAVASWSFTQIGMPRGRRHALRSVWRMSRS
jgi:hypothetical protein